MSEKCQHMNFSAHVEVARITDGEGGPASHFNAHIKIACCDCGVDMVFTGLPRGINLNEPVAGVFGIEARLPIRPVEPKDVESETMRVVIPNGK